MGAARRLTCGHDGRLDGGGAPLFRVERAAETDDAGDACGHDMDVPDSELKATRRGSKARSVGELARVHAAITLTPGAVMSGCNTGETSVKPFAATGELRSRMDRSVKNLEDLWSDGVGSLRREGGHERRRLRAKDSRRLSDEAGRIPVR